MKKLPTVARRKIKPPGKRGVKGTGRRAPDPQKLIPACSGALNLSAIPPRYRGVSVQHLQTRGGGALANSMKSEIAQNTRASCPGLTRASTMGLHTKILTLCLPNRRMDCRVKPGNDGGEALR
jgi:hypothetical protein